MSSVKHKGPKNVHPILGQQYSPWARGDMLPPPPRDFCKPCFLVRLWYTKIIERNYSDKNIYN